MYLRSIHINNFRCFKDYDFEFASKVTVLFGKNGSGKTTLIHAIHKALSFIMYSDNIYKNVKVKGKNKREIIDVKTITNNNPYLHPKSFAKDDFNNHEDKLIEISANADVDEELKDINWKISVFANNCKLRTTEFIEAFRDFYRWHESTGKLPLLAYFSDSFPHKEDNKKGKTVKKISDLRNFGYFDWDEEEGCTNEWIQRIETKLKRWVQISAQNYFESKMDFNIDSRLKDTDEKELASIEKEISAITDCFKRFSSNIQVNENLKIEIARLWLGKEDNRLCIVTPNGEEYSFTKLPAGYKRLYNIVLDLAYRSYILSEGNSTNIPGIAIIDEIDLHLHPELEQIVLSLFTNTFPSLQFIISTHSPLVLSNFNQRDGKPSEYSLIKMLKKENIFVKENILDIFGLDYNSSVINIMETPQNIRYKDELIQTYKYWKEKDLEKANRIASLIREKYGDNSSIIQELNL